MNTSRRVFLMSTIGAGASLWLARAHADSPRVSETDPAAAAVGYREDAAKVDRARYPNFAPDQACANCSLFQGKSADAWAGCTLFSGRQVAARGWCASYTNM